MSVRWDVVSALAGAGSAAVAAVAAIIAARATADSRRLVRVEADRRAEEVERASHAALLLYLEDDYLRVHNMGPAAAQWISLGFVEIPDVNMPHLLGGDLPPFDLLPGATRSMRYVFLMGGPAEWQCELRWTDPAGDHTERRTVWPA